jgi:FAD/FMN-containing dehydrogenase
MTIAVEHNPYFEDASGFRGWADAIEVPNDEAELLEIVRRANQSATPLTIAGAGSGLTGGRVPQGGCLLSMERFRRLDIVPGRARVGAAITLLELREAAAKSGQFYAPDPTEIGASIGGTIATNASGSRSFRYGSTRRHIQAMRVVHADGRVREYRRRDAIDFPVETVPPPRTTKCAAGYQLRPGMDWIDLLCGSEGTLAITLEAEVSLLPIPAELFTGVIFFPSDEAALDAVDAWPPVTGLRMLEYLDCGSLSILHDRYPEFPREADAALLLEADGEIDLDAWLNRLDRAKALTEQSWFATSGADRERFRKLRHALAEVVNATVAQHGFLKMGTDYAVPLDRNREMLAFYRQVLDQKLPGQYVMYGHIGDAHVHVNMLPSTQAQADTATALLTEFAAHAVKLGGTVSAEHGLGKRKAHLLALQYSPQQIQAMVEVKQRLDPQWLLGRGNLFAPPSSGI